jgi:hypothetical protein
MITASFFFKQMEILIIMIYMPLNNKEERRLIQRKVVEKYIKRSPRTQIIIMGDFNEVVDADLDRSHSRKQRLNKQDPLINWLKRQDFQDAFRMVNPKQQEFSWSRGEVSSRIDFIWLANELTSSLFESEMQDMDICTHSDHKAVTAKLVLDYWVVPSSAAKVRRSGQKRTVFLYDKATKDDWDDYRAELERRICGKVNIAEMNNSSRSDRNREEERVMNNW